MRLGFVLLLAGLLAGKSIAGDKPAATGKRDYELYDLTTDPLETNNLATGPAHGAHHATAAGFVGRDAPCSPRSERGQLRGIAPFGVRSHRRGAIPTRQASRPTSQWTMDMAAVPRCAPAHAAVLKELAAQLEAWQKDLPPVPMITGVAPEPAAGTPVNVEKVKRKDRKPKSKKEE